ncbi:hypothetical protein HYU11_01900 [Candidatus Woesearchaeota archaeon]|nr:hypothetical protein [Candidatus Woesearchaeota archaeon]
MAKTLSIAPLHTELDSIILEGLHSRIEERFRPCYSSISLNEKIRDPNNSCLQFLDGQPCLNLIYLIEYGRLLPPYLLINGDVLVVTDHYGKMYDSLTKGIAFVDDLASLAMISTQNMLDEPEKILRRLVALAIHEVGHMNGLPHHVLKNPDGYYCPMAPSSIDSLPESKAYPMDFRSDEFCNECIRNLKKQLSDK